MIRDLMEPGREEERSRPCGNLQMEKKGFRQAGE
jgi:hypothetical protein